MGHHIAHTAADVAFIAANAGKIPDHLIAEALGFTTRKVFTLRKQNAIPSGYKKRRPQAVIDAVRREYVEAGRSAADVGLELGVTATSIRRIAQESGMKRSRVFMARNAGEATRRRLAANPRPRRERPPAKPLVLETRLLSADDSALIADFMARKTVTVLPPGQAAGTTQWERLLGTAKPDMSNWRDQHARQHANHAHRRRLELARTAGGLG
jgi:hypothetical protein